METNGTIDKKLEASVVCLGMWNREGNPAIRSCEVFPLISRGWPPCPTKMGAAWCWKEFGDIIGDILLLRELGKLRSEGVHKILKTTQSCPNQE